MCVTVSSGKAVWKFSAVAMGTSDMKMVGGCFVCVFLFQV